MIITLKLNTGKCHLVISGFKYERIWAKSRKDEIWEDKDVKRLRVTIDTDLRFALSSCTATV